MLDDATVVDSGGFDRYNEQQVYTGDRSSAHTSGDYAGGTRAAPWRNTTATPAARPPWPGMAGRPAPGEPGWPGPPPNYVPRPMSEAEIARERTALRTETSGEASVRHHERDGTQRPRGRDDLADQHADRRDGIPDTPSDIEHQALNLGGYTTA